MIAYFCTSALREWDQKALDDLDRLSIEFLARIPRAEAGLAAMLLKISEQLKVLESIRDLVGPVASLPAIARDIGIIRKAPQALEEAAQLLAEAGQLHLSTSQRLSEASRELAEASKRPIVAKLEMTRG